MTEPIDESLLTTSKSEGRLNPRELEMYREHRRKLLTWMPNEGRAPEMNVGYAEETVENRSYRLDMFYRWVWDVEDGYTENITISHANAFMKYLQPQSYSQAYKAAYQKSIHTLFRWQRHELNKNVDWKPTLHFYDSAVPSSVEPLTHDERQALREAVLDHESVPHYNSLNPKQRDRWKSYLAQRFQKPKPEVSKEDFERANSWKWPALIWTSLDAGLRPKEVGRAKVSWVDTKKALAADPAGRRSEESETLERWAKTADSNTTGELDRRTRDRREIRRQ